MTVGWANTKTVATVTSSSEIDDDSSDDDSCAHARMATCEDGSGSDEDSDSEPGASTDAVPKSNRGITTFEPCDPPVNPADHFTAIEPDPDDGLDGRYTPTAEINNYLCDSSADIESKVQAEADDDEAEYDAAVAEVAERDATMCYRVDEFGEQHEVDMLRSNSAATRDTSSSAPGSQQGPGCTTPARLTPRAPLRPRRSRGLWTPTRTASGAST